MKTTLAERIKLARDDAELTQEELARAVGISKSALQRYEGGDTPPADRLARIAKVTKVDPGWLLSGTDSPAHAKLENIKKIVLSSAPEDPEDSTGWIVGTVFPNKQAARERPDQKRKGK